MTAADVDRRAADLDDAILALVRAFVTWLETGNRTGGLFAEDAFADLTLPRWRLQAAGADGAFRLREERHPFPGTVHVEALDRTSRGFLVQVEERWEDGGERWYCRELMHCAVVEGSIKELVVYCTGDWDQERREQHSAEVRLLRP